MEHPESTTGHFQYQDVQDIEEERGLPEHENRVPVMGFIAECMLPSEEG
jgi:hypothetical protein